FAIATDGCTGQVIAAGASCNLAVQFTPQVSGAPTAQINVRTASTVLGTATVSGKATPIWTKEMASVTSKPLNVVRGTDSSQLYAAGAGGYILARSGGA